jgi:hypothetical protein
MIKVYILFKYYGMGWDGSYKTTWGYAKTTWEYDEGKR